MKSGESEFINRLVHIEATASLESFRNFIIIIYIFFIPESYLRDYEVFPEREEGPGEIYIEAADKVTLKKIREMTFVNVREILGIIYSSKSGNTQLKWWQTRKKVRQGIWRCILQRLSKFSRVRGANARMGGQLLDNCKSERQGQ